MSWHGTVHCSYCGQRGHNRSGCPERRKKALADPEPYEGRSYAREQKRRRAQIENRSCSYCKEKGHNRRGCPILKEDKKLVASRQSEFLREFSEVSSSVGLAPGALVEVPRGEESHDGGIWSKGFVATVTDITWNNIDFAFKDLDTSSSWRYKDRGFAHCRVLKTFGYDEEENYWNAPPKFNDLEKITYENIYSLAKGVFHPNGLGVNPEAHRTLRILGPQHRRFQLPDNNNMVTHELKSLFHLDPGPRADDYEKERVPFHQLIWANLRPEEHQKALAERKELGYGW